MLEIKSILTFWRFCNIFMHYKNRQNVGQLFFAPEIFVNNEWTLWDCILPHKWFCIAQYISGIHFILWPLMVIQLSLCLSVSPQVTALILLRKSMHFIKKLILIYGIIFPEVGCFYMLQILEHLLNIDNRKDTCSRIRIA